MTKKSLVVSKKDLVLPVVPENLLGDLRQMIDGARQSIATAINVGLTDLPHKKLLKFSKRWL